MKIFTSKNLPPIPQDRSVHQDIFYSLGSWQRPDNQRMFPPDKLRETGSHSSKSDRLGMASFCNRISPSNYKSNQVGTVYSLGFALCQRLN